MIAVRPCSAICVVDSVPVLIRFYPDTGELFFTDAAGRCLYECRWKDTWGSLMATMRRVGAGLAQGDTASRDLSKCLLDCARRDARRARSARKAPLRAM